MALKYYSEAEAEKIFEATLVSWASNQGYKGCYSAGETEEAIDDLKEWSRESLTARKVMFCVEMSFREIAVVGMKGGFQCFDSGAGPKKNIPTVFIDLDGKLTVNVRGPHNLHLDPMQCTGNVLALDNDVALLHEFGHAKQFLERPLLFENSGTEFDPRHEREGFARAIREQAELVLKNKSKKGLLSKPELEARLKDRSEHGPKWMVAIELDNMSRHEWPICRELGLPRRANYRDINCTSDGAPSLTSVIRNKVVQEKAREQKQLRERGTELKGLGAGVKVCPTCKLPFKSSLALNTHFLVHPECQPK